MQTTCRLIFPFFLVNPILELHRHMRKCVHVNTCTRIVTFAQSMFDETILAYGSDEEEGMKYVSTPGLVMLLKPCSALSVLGLRHTYAKIHEHHDSFADVSQHTCWFRQCATFKIFSRAFWHLSGPLDFGRTQSDQRAAAKATASE